MPQIYKPISPKQGTHVSSCQSTKLKSRTFENAERNPGLAIARVGQQRPGISRKKSTENREPLKHHCNAHQRRHTNSNKVKEDAPRKRCTGSETYVCKRHLIQGSGVGYSRWMCSNGSISRTPVLMQEDVAG
jgi:hypothetical protein